MMDKQTAWINEQKIWDLLEEGRLKKNYREILKKASTAKGLSPLEAAALLQAPDNELWDEIFKTARRVKEEIYGHRIVLFAPLYISDYCINSCLYCGYHQQNQTKRRRLSQQEIENEVQLLEEMGHKRLAVECGEDPVNAPLDYILESIKTIYRVRKANGNIRRVNINIAATTIEDYRQLKAANIGTYILFQETYHRSTYEQVHPSGPKHDYDWHTTAFDRAMKAGIDDVGAGVLFGLYDYRFEILALLLHAAHLEEVFGVGPHTVSVPRLRAATGVDLSAFPLVTDQQFRKIVAIIRLALPYTGMILSTREEPSLRREVISLGISQVSAGSCTGVGGYSHRKNGVSQPQFEVADRRTMPQVLEELTADGYIPSFCTACYRQGRTGDRFMSLAKTGEIKKVCAPNAILTFQEYLLDYAPELTRIKGQAAIEKELRQLPPEIKDEVNARLQRINEGERDLYF
ncbi:MAG TPA: [FeFe] hydrogenase H-cluster radical SAM maturase HydG [Firmicutes bacterium]|jgi:2-iminoacetate synthase|nr:[FeFe] hydrogenase H-cluster radical SAM maturase HydG [Bacillota bacterium]